MYILNFENKIQAMEWTYVQNLFWSSGSLSFSYLQIQTQFNQVLIQPLLLEYLADILNDQRLQQGLLNNLILIHCHNVTDCLPASMNGSPCKIKIT
jgi:hypothetical protein